MESIELKSTFDSSHTFNDGSRSIDYVLVWKKEKKVSSSSENWRKTFESNLVNEGLHLEYEASQDLRGIHFIKIHVPIETLRRFSEILKIRMPMKVEYSFKNNKKSKNVMRNCYDWFLSIFSLDTTIFPEREHRLTAIYSRDKENLFDTSSEFWSPLVRLRIIQYILDREKYADHDHSFGISRLISNSTYTAAYPLHDGDLKTPGSMRYLLNTHWASLKKCFKFQPLQYLKDYFGVKIGIYFAWLGFYTIMLIPASIVGLICVLYSLSTVVSHKSSEEICNYNSVIKVCPTSENGDYWDLRDACMKFRIAYLADNPATVFFAVFMSIWSVCFLELWKRYSAEMNHQWDLTGFDLYEEHPRPQYLVQSTRFKKMQYNVVTCKYEPVVPFWKVRVPVGIISYSFIVLLVVTLIFTELALLWFGENILKKHDSNILKKFNKVPLAAINLCFIIIFGFTKTHLFVFFFRYYEHLAKWLTDKELLRTQKEYEDSLTLKIYVLQFVNNYASIFYIAFFKGKFVNRFGEDGMLFDQKQLECSPGGCLVDLSIQLAIIMVGKQFLGAIKEMAQPFLVIWWKSLRNMNSKKNKKRPLQMVQDFKLVDMGDMALFPEYLEMVIQFGFITIFVSAFPLAPLFALLNNIICEMRLDAKKFVRCYRRSVPQRVHNIGVWYRILDCVGKLSVITNGFIIAFTSEFIPQLLYAYKYGDLNNYVQLTLDKTNITNLQHSPTYSTYKELQCSNLRYSYNEPNDEIQRAWYWKVMCARVLFVLVFQNTIYLIMIIIRWAIPDMPRDLRYRIHREAFVTQNLILEQSRSRPQHRHRNSIGFEGV